VLCSKGASAQRWTVVRQRVVETVEYEKGAPNGRVVLFDGPDARTEGEYSNGLRSGTWLVFDNGVLAQTQQWKEGKRWGLGRRLQGDGGVREEQTWAGDVPSGHWVKYDDDGKKQVEGAFTAGARSGLWTRYSVLGDVAQQWMEPADGGPGAARDGGTIDPRLSGAGLETFYAGMTVREWRIRLGEVTRASEADPSFVSLRELTLHRAKLAGLTVDGGRLEEPDP
jgi:hypothetical protein